MCSLETWLNEDEIVLTECPATFSIHFESGSRQLSPSRTDRETDGVRQSDRKRLVDMQRCLNRGVVGGTQYITTQAICFEAKGTTKSVTVCIYCVHILYAYTVCTYYVHMQE